MHMLRVWDFQNQTYISVVNVCNAISIIPHMFYEVGGILAYDVPCMMMIETSWIIVRSKSFPWFHFKHNFLNVLITWIFINVFVNTFFKRRIYVPLWYQLLVLCLVGIEFESNPLICILLLSIVTSYHSNFNKIKWYFKSFQSYAVFIFILCVQFLLYHSNYFELVFLILWKFE